MPVRPPASWHIVRHPPAGKLLGRLLVWIVKERRLRRSGIREIDQMDGHRFEQYLRTAFVRIGYSSATANAKTGCGMS